jgi:SAM-dependent methyltransferase
MITRETSKVLNENIQKLVITSSIPLNLRKKFHENCQKNYKNPNRFLIPLNRIIEFLSPLDGKIVVDVGCRFGSYLIELSYLGMTTVGIDIVPGWVKILKERSKQLGLKIDCIIGDGTCLSLNNNSVDAVIATQYFTHVKDFSYALSEIIRILKHGGKLMIIDRTLALFSFIRLFRVGGLEWLKSKSRVKLLYGKSYLGKDEDAHSFLWWRKEMLNPKLKNIKIYSSGRCRGGLLNWLLHFIIGSVWIFSQKK